MKSSQFQSSVLSFETSHIGGAQCYEYPPCDSKPVWQFHNSPEANAAVNLPQAYWAHNVRLAKY